MVLKQNVHTHTHTLTHTHTHTHTHTTLLMKVLSLLKDFQVLIYVVVPELLRAIRNIQVQLEKTGPMCNLKHHKVGWFVATESADKDCPSHNPLSLSLICF